MDRTSSNPKTNAEVDLVTSIPFSFLGAENYSTMTSTPSEGISNDPTVFVQELKKLHLFKELKQKNPIKELQPPNTTGRFSKARARSNSPTRESLTILNRNHQIFPAFNPVVASPEAPPVKFAALGQCYPCELEEDEELHKIKELYCKMIDNAEEDNDAWP